MSDFFNFSPKNPSVKDAVILLLSEGEAFSSKEIHNRIKKRFKIASTYQATHKVIKVLEKEKVLEKNESKYRLSLSWITQLKNFVSNIEQSYKMETPIIKDPKNLEFMQVEFDHFYDLADFIVSEIWKLHIKNKVFIARHESMYSNIGISKPQLNQIRTALKFVKHYILCKNSTVLDKLFGYAWEKSGVTVKYGVNCASECDSYIIGNHIVKIYLLKSFRTKIHNFYRKTKKVTDLDLEKFTKLLHNKKTKIKVIIIRDKDLADQLRKESLEYFK